MLANAIECLHFILSLPFPELREKLSPSTRHGL
jgi:hypothetical protein